MGTKGRTLRRAVLASLIAVGCSGARPGTGGTDASAPDHAMTVHDARGALDARTTDSPLDEGAPDGPGPYVLCDGSQRLRFRAFYGGGGPDVMGSYVRIENGFFFLMVDGTCAFWLGGAWVDAFQSRDQPILTGTLTAAEAARLETGLPLGNLASVNGCSSQPLDAGERMLRAEGSAARCGGTGAAFEAAWTVVTDTVAAIRGRARPLEGAMRVSAVATSSYPGTSAAPPYEWTLATPLASLFVDLGSRTQEGISHLVTDAGDAARLRALRARYLTDRAATPGIFSGWDGMPVKSGDTWAQVFMRDALPYEDARGLITF